MKTLIHAARRGHGLLLPVFATLLLASCGESATTPSAPAAVAAVRLSANGATLLRGETLELTATPLSADGEALPARIATWESTDPAVATVDGGRITALGLGTTRVSAVIEARRAEAEIVVLPRHPAELEGEWRMRSFDGVAVPGPYVVLLDEPVGDSVIARVEIRLDSASMRIVGTGRYDRRRYCFTELHDDVPRFRYCWGDHGLLTLGAGSARGRIRLTSYYIQNLNAEGEARGDLTLAMLEPLWVQEEPRRTVWERR